MISAGNFLLFYIGLETASLPIAALVAFNKYKHESAEAGAKYIFNAIFSSGVMVFGLSFLYGACGTLYYTDIAANIYSTPLVIMAMIFILSGLFFKISLVRFTFGLQIHTRVRLRQLLYTCLQYPKERLCLP